MREKPAGNFEPESETEVSIIVGNSRNHKRGFSVEEEAKTPDWWGVETDVLAPNESSDADQELARRIQLIYKTHARGLNGFFDRIEHDEREREQELVRKRESRLKRLIESAVCPSAERADTRS